MTPPADRPDCPWRPTQFRVSGVYKRTVIVWVTDRRTGERVRRKVARFDVRYRVDGHQFSYTFEQRGWADSFARRLHEAFAEGRLFDPDSRQFTDPPTDGDPGGARVVSFFDVAVEYVERKWRRWEPASRRNAQRDIARACLLLVVDDAPALSADELRAADRWLRSHALMPDNTETGDRRRGVRRGRCAGAVACPGSGDRRRDAGPAGGGDLQPSAHGRGAHGSVYGVAARRDRFDLRLAAAARERRVPLLAICRGMQVVNVALGGDLIVDIPSEIGTQVLHRIPEPGVVAGHPIRIQDSSALAALLGTTRIDVNSSHHQAIRALGRGLSPVAWAEDGVVEAAEAADATWTFIGVQWHPEYRTPDNAAARCPFEALIDATRHRTLAR